MSIWLPPVACITIRLWRVALCALALDERRFARPLRSFKKLVPTVIVEFDASLLGVGILIFDLQDGQETVLGGCAVSLSSLEFKKPDYQNTAEFIAVILGLVALRRLRRSDSAILFRGDSTTALTWAEKERFTGTYVTNAAVVFVLTMLTLRLEATSSHLAAENNKRCDYLSRHHNATLGEVGLSGIPQLHLNNDSIVNNLLHLCDPRTNISTEDTFQAFWKEVGQCIGSL